MKDLYEKDPNFLIDYTTKVFFWGSCFSENISNFLNHNEFNCLNNSHGIQFNPLSIEEAIKDCIELKTYSEGDLNKRNDVFFSYKFHGDFEALNSDEALTDMNQSIIEFNHQLKSSQCPVIFITLGSAWYYKLKKDNSIVANCHKVPTDQFSKQMMTPKEVFNSLERTHNLLCKYLGDFKLILTVSPVRHKKDGWIENNLSKSALLLGINEFTSKHSNTKYFPVYEWVIDILRDYSYFEEDGVHPNKKAQRFIFDKVQNLFINDEALEIINSISRFKAQFNHRPKLPGSNDHKKFLKTLLEQIHKLQKEYSFLHLNSYEEQIVRDIEKYK